MAAQPVVAWTVPETAPPVRVTSELRVHAAIIGGCVPALTACAMWWLGFGGYAAVPAFGVPIGALLAAADARRMVSPTWPLAVLRVAFAAPLVATVVLLAGSAASSVDTGAGPQALIGLLGLVVFVGLFALALALPVTLATAWVSAFLLRRDASMEPRRARIHLASLVGATLVAVAVTWLAENAADVLSGAWTG